MATNTRYYESTDAGAPVLTGQVGSLISLLKILLVGTAGVAYGSKASAGWTNAYEDVVLRKIALRNSVAAGGSGCYLRIDDNGGLSGGAREASARMYGAMTTVDVGTDETPTVAAQAAGCVWRKSSTLDATARRWLCAADERTVYLCVAESVTVGTSTREIVTTYYAGDYQTDDPLQTHPFGINGFKLGGSSAPSNTDPNGILYTWTSSSALNLWLSRSVTHVAGPTKAGLLGICSGTSDFAGSDNAGFPNPQSGSGNTYFVPLHIGVYVSSSNKSYMGRLRGAWLPLSTTTADAFTKVYTGGPGFGFTSLKLFTHNTNASFGNLGAKGGICIETQENWA